MKNILLFLTFIIYILLIFLFDSFIMQITFFVINLIILLFSRLSFKKFLYNIYLLSPFIILTAIINVILEDIYYASLVSIKLILVCNITYIFKTKLGTSTLIDIIQKTFTPAKLIGISPKDISLIINIAITFIPNLLRDFIDIQNLVLSKGVKKHSVKHMKYTFKILFNSIFIKTNDMEFCLKSKGYIE